MSFWRCKATAVLASRQKFCGLLPEVVATGAGICDNLQESCRIASQRTYFRHGFIFSEHWNSEAQGLFTTFFGFWGGGMRQLWQTSDWLLQYGPICLYNFGWNLWKKLEWAEIRHNFASSIRTNDTSQNWFDKRSLTYWYTRDKRLELSAPERLLYQSLPWLNNPRAKQQHSNIQQKNKKQKRIK